MWELLASYQKPLQQAMFQMEEGYMHQRKVGSEQSEEGPNRGWEQTEDVVKQEEDSKEPGEKAKEGDLFEA